MSMAWSDERYVRLYTRDTVEWMAWNWQARAIFPSILRKCDRAGIIDLGRHGYRGLAGLIAMPIEVVEAGMACLTDEETGGPIEIHGQTLVFRNFIEAQEAAQTDRLRKAESRAKRRERGSHGPEDGPKGDVTKRDSESRNVTIGHETGQNVTSGHTASRLVTPSLAVPSLTKTRGERGVGGTGEGDGTGPPSSDSSAQPGLPGLHVIAGGLAPKPPSKRELKRREKAAQLERHRTDALRLWRLQESLRREINPRAIDRPPGQARLSRVMERLQSGVTVAECEMALVQYAEEAANKPEENWFDGVSNWRPDNLERKLGRPLSGWARAKLAELRARAGRETA